MPLWLPMLLGNKDHTNVFYNRPAPIQTSYCFPSQSQTSFGIGVGWPYFYHVTMYDVVTHHE